MQLFRQKSDHIRCSFDNVKKDTSLIFDWISYLYQKTQQHEHILNHHHKSLGVLHNWLAHSRTNHLDKEIKLLHSKVELLNKKLSVLASLYDHHKSRIEELHSKLNAEPVKRKSALKEKMIKKISTNSKHYIKNTIISYIHKYHDIPALELKEIVVDEQALCSKSSFYRILNELEKDERVGVVKKGSQKIYLKKVVP